MWCWSVLHSCVVFVSIMGTVGMLVCAVGAELATLAFQCMLPAVIITLTGSRLLLLFALWNPEAVKQIEKWCISTFSRSLNLEHFSAAQLPLARM